MKKFLLLYILCAFLFHDSSAQLQASKNVYLTNNPDVWPYYWWLTYHNDPDNNFNSDGEIFKVFGSSVETLNAYVVNDGSADVIVLFAYYDEIGEEWTYQGVEYGMRAGGWVIRMKDYGESSGCSGFGITCDYGVTIEASQRRVSALIDIDQLNKEGLGGKTPIYAKHIITYEGKKCSTNWTDDGSNNLICNGTVTTKEVLVQLVVLVPDEHGRSEIARCEDGEDMYLIHPNTSILASNWPGIGFEDKYLDFIADITTDNGNHDYVSGEDVLIDVSEHGPGIVDMNIDWIAPAQYYLNRNTDFEFTQEFPLGEVYEVPTVSVQSSDHYCNNTGLVDLPDGTPEEGIWSGTHVSANQFDTDAASPGEYILTYTYTTADGCSASDNMTVTLEQVNVSTLDDVTICSGDNFIIEAFGASSYTWSPGTGLSSTVGSSVIASPTTTTTYTVTGTSEDGCTDTDEIVINVNPLPDATVTSNATDDIICKNEPVVLSAPDAGARATYSWTPSSKLDNPNLREPTAVISSSTEFRVRITDGNGCENDGTLYVTVNDLPVANAGENLIACFGTDQQLDGTESSGEEPLQYSWSGTGIVNGGSTATPTINITSDQVYVLTVTDNNGCSSSDQVVATASAANASAGLDKTICEGSSTQLSASGGISYLWSPSTGLNDNTVSSPVASPTTTTDYTVTVTDGNGCVDTDVVRVNVVAQPTLNVPSDQTICQGESMTLTVSGNSSSYEWSGQGLNVLFGSSVEASPSSTTIYQVTGSLNGCETTEEITVYVNSLPTVNAGLDDEICSGESIELQGTQNANYTYSWSGSNILSEADTFNPIVSPAVSSNYTLTVTDPNGCSNSDVVRITVNSVSPNAGSDKTICLGETVQLSGSGGVTYFWEGDELNDPNISSPTATPLSAGNHVYTVTVTSADGCTDTDQVNVNVLGLPTLVLPADQSICKGESVVLSASGAQSYDWSPSTGLNVDNLASVTASPSSTVVYTVEGTGSNGCTVEEQIVVYVNDPPDADAGSNKETCIGEDLVLNGSATLGVGPYSYSWSGVGIISGEDTSSPTINISTDQTYTLTVTDANGCTDIDQVDVDVNSLPNALISVNDFVTTSADICRDETVQLEAFGGSGYLWSGDPGISNPNIQNPVITVDDTKVLSVLVTNSNGCESQATITLNAVDNPVVDAGGILEVCIDDDPYDLRQDVNIQGGAFTGPGITNDFLFDPSDAGIGIHIVTYDVTVGTCSGSITREIRVKEKPIISTITDQEICPGDSLQLNAFGGTTYSWFPETGMNNPNIANPKVAPLITTSYTVTGMDIYGCENTATVTVSVNDLSVNAGVNQVICEGESVELDGSSSKSNVIYEWLPDIGLNDNSIASPVASPETTTTYTLSVTDVLGCTVSDQVKVTVEEQPDLVVGPKLFVCNSDNSPIDLRDDVNIPGGSFSSASSGLEGVLFYGNREDPGIYFISYEVAVGNCELSASREVEVLPDPVTSVNGSEFTICNGESIQLSASGGSAYSWFPTEGLSSATIANPVATPLSTTVYSVEITDSENCSVTRTIEVNVQSVSPFAGNDVSICEGESIQLSASGGSLYSWSHGASLNDANVSNPIASPLVTTTYVVTVTDNDGCTGTDEVKVVVEPAPLLDLGGDISLCQDASESVDVRTFANISGGTWTSDSPALDGVIFNPAEEDPGIVFLNYSVTNDGCTVQGTKEIRILSKPEVSVIEDQEICKGESVQLSASGGVSYEWSPKTNMDNAFVFNPVVTPLSTTVYAVTITDLNGCRNTASVEVVVDTPETTVTPDVTICQGESVELVASGGNSYLWNNAGSLSDPNDNNPIASPLSTTLYTVQITNRNGCTAYEEVLITVTPAPDLEVGDVLTLCHNGDEPYDLRQDVSVSGGVFSSTSNGLVGVEFIPSQVSNPGIYFVDYTVTIETCTVTKTREIRVKGDPVINTNFDSYDICAGESVQLNVSGGETYEWFPNVAINNPKIKSPVVNPVVDQTYTVIVTNSFGCTSSKEIDINVSTFNANAGEDLTICYGETVQLDATGGLNYEWTDTTGTLSDNSIRNPFATPTETTVYTVNMTSSDGCVDQDQVKVTVLENPEITFIDSEVSICENEDIVDLNSNINYIGASWEGPGVTTTGLFDQEDSGPGSFILEVSYENLLGCVDTDYLIVRVPRKPTVYAGPDISVCSSDSVIDISSLATPAGGSFFGAGIINNQFFSPLSAGPGEYEVSYAYTDPTTGCTNSDTRIITVLNSIAVFAGPPTSLCIDADPLDLSLSVSPPGGVFIADSAVNGNYFYPSSGVGEYHVYYSVTDNNNCTSTAERIIIVNDRPLLELDSDIISVCENDGILNLNEYPNIPGGTWSGSSGIVNGLLKVDSLGIGSNILSYDVVTSDGCSLSTELIVEVSPVQNLALGGTINTCFGGDPIDLIGNFNREVVFVSGMGVTDGIFYPSSVDRGTYEITYEYENSNGCVAEQKRVVVVQGEVFVSTDDHISICKNFGDVDLSTHGFPEGGVWSGAFVTLGKFNSTAASVGQYEAIYTLDLGLGCVNSDTLLIDVTNSNISSFGTDTLLCVNSSELGLNFSDELEGGRWSGPGVINDVFYPSEAGPGTWELTYSNDALECDVAGTRTIRVIDVPSKAITDSYSLSGCVGDIIRITADLIDQSVTAQVNYEWYYEGETEPFAIGKNIDFRIRESENIYFVSVNQFGCEALESDFIRISANGPVGDFFVNKDSAEIGELVRFSSSSSNTDAFFWEFGDGNYSELEDPIYYYYSTGWHTVSLTMYSPDDCDYTITKEDFIFIHEPMDPADTVTVLSTESVQTENLIISPNPNSGSFVLRGPEGIIGGKVSIMSLAGKLIQEVAYIKNQEITIELNDKVSGTYLLLFTKEGKDPVYKKMIIRK